MEYLIVLIEGIIAFISPCVLPMLPIYISYFSGEEKSKKKTFLNSIFFVIGFSIVFVALGVFIGYISMYISSYRKYINIILGILVILFGINFLDIIKLPFINKTVNVKLKKEKINYLSSTIFGMVFAICWTPCVGTFLSSALMYAASFNSIFKGIIMLTLFCIGLGIPFIISSILLYNLKEAFNFIKTHYNIINKVSGALLVIIGILIITSVLN